MCQTLSEVVGVTAFNPPSIYKASTTTSHYFAGEETEVERSNRLNLALVS